MADFIIERRPGWNRNALKGIYSGPAKPGDIITVADRLPAEHITQLDSLGRFRGARPTPLGSARGKPHRREGNFHGRRGSYTRN